ncbi:PP2C family protein-serine/threonine phosphatase [Kribbella sp. VKM Ac-2568]|uniref:PP2C family protein-serine/threonine phosphatase n=1 Tax=Kribbella sp. VKM Ac-2568 TaxID=2512219 RepID=UPI00104DDB43|nr:PP2C family protein-serine/threonine phosphatase [Kribbella sp. VKM Ac-2568]TCM43687.1 stage II sporulation protein E [Kribbella sp. VKM Ac-2568]
MSGGAGIAVVRRIGRRVETALRRARRSHRLAFVGLLVFTVGLSVTALALPSLIPTTVFVIPLLLGGLLLRFRPLLALTLITLMLGSYVVSERAAGLPKTGFVLTLGIAAWIVLTSAKVRSRLGVPGTRGESMLIELRDTLTAQGELPDLPAEWLAEQSIQSAGGAKFSGDFVVSTTRGDELEVALVDVSGKGIDAGTRALLLSGAFGGLLGVVPVEEFLPAANHYLRRQDWDDDFATVVHVAVNLTSGDFEVRTAGHPPAIQFDAWSGRWQTRDADGPLLGLMEAPDFQVNKGQLKLGDALFLYSDGMVETPQRDIGQGTDRLAGHAERLVAKGFKGAADELVKKIGGPGDDSAIVIIHRRMHPADLTPECPPDRAAQLRRRGSALLRL